MGEEAFITQIKEDDFNVQESVLDSIFQQYERVIIESLITSFGLDFLVKDQYGGDVDTVLNVRKIAEDPQLQYKNSLNKKVYENREEYDSEVYHKHNKYKEINKHYSNLKMQGELKDVYTGKTVVRNAHIDLDHVVAAKEISDDPGRILAGLKGQDLANCEENLKPTDRSINRSMKQKNADEYLVQWDEKQSERRKQIVELRSKQRLTDKEQKKLNKLEKLEEIDPELMKKENKKSRQAYDGKINRAYYASPEFQKDVSYAAGKRGMEMGLRQALGFVFMEIWFCTKEEIRNLPDGSGLKEMLESVGHGVEKGLESSKNKYKEVIAKLKEGFGAGALASLTTSICNIFFTTAKNLVKCIRQIYASVIQAGKVLLFNPDNLMFGDRLKMTITILTTGASVLVGTAIGEAISKTPIGMTPSIGPVVQVFCSTLVSGLISCTFLIFMDRSKLINQIVDCLNAIPSEANNYREIADLMEQLAAKLSQIDIEKFKEETEKYNCVANQIQNSKDEEELNQILLGAYKDLEINLPWTGDFDSFMGNKNNRLVFR